MDHVQDHVDQLYKSNFGRLVASLLSFSNDIDLSSAEDIVQEAFSAALTDWRKNGIPSNAPGWLYTVCRNKALNQIRKAATNSMSLNHNLVVCEEEKFFCNGSFAFE